MGRLKCVVFRGLPKELEEQVNKFLESTTCTIHYVVQSESGDHLSLTMIYELDPQEGE
jgi:hypothetical protein